MNCSGERSHVAQKGPSIEAHILTYFDTCMLEAPKQGDPNSHNPKRLLFEEPSLDQMFNSSLCQMYLNDISINDYGNTI